MLHVTEPSIGSETASSSSKSTPVPVQPNIKSTKIVSNNLVQDKCISVNFTKTTAIRETTKQPHLKKTTVEPVLSSQPHNRTKINKDGEKSRQCSGTRKYTKLAVVPGKDISKPVTASLKIKYPEHISATSYSDFPKRLHGGCSTDSTMSQSHECEIDSIIKRNPNSMTKQVLEHSMPPGSKTNYLDDIKDFKLSSTTELLNMKTVNGDKMISQNKHALKTIGERREIKKEKLKTSKRFKYTDDMKKIFFFKSNIDSHECKGNMKDLFFKRNIVSYACKDETADSKSFTSLKSNQQASNEREKIRGIFSKGTL